MSKIVFNWEALKRKYLSGKYVSIREFCDKEKIRYATCRRHSKSWVKEKREINRIATERVKEKTIDAITEMNERHILRSKKFQDKAYDSLESLDFETASDAARTFRIGVEIEREIMLPKGEDREIKLIIEGIPRPGEITIQRSKKDKNEKDI